MLSKTGITAQESNSLWGCDPSPNKVDPWKVGHLVPSFPGKGRRVRVPLCWALASKSAVS